VAEGAVIHGNVYAREVYLNGIVDGDIHALEVYFEGVGICQGEIDALQIVKEN
jgi:cytoskeletal protein CcmA (bactofilin family)